MIFHYMYLVKINTNKLNFRISVQEFSFQTPKNQKKKAAVDNERSSSIKASIRTIRKTKASRVISAHQIDAMEAEGIVFFSYIQYYLSLFLSSRDNYYTPLCLSLSLFRFFVAVCTRRFFFSHLRLFSRDVCFVGER